MLRIVGFLYSFFFFYHTAVSPASMDSAGFHETMIFDVYYLLKDPVHINTNDNNVSIGIFIAIFWRSLKVQ